MGSPETVPPDATDAVATAAVGSLRCAWDDCGPLKGGQKRFASDRCRAAWHDAQHPRLDVDPTRDRRVTIKQLILGILADGAWHTAYDLSLKARRDKHSIVSRISELRRAGHRIEEDLPVGNCVRPHRYRLVTP